MNYKPACQPELQNKTPFQERKTSKNSKRKLLRMLFILNSIIKSIFLKVCIFIVAKYMIKFTILKYIIQRRYVHSCLCTMITSIHLQNLKIDFIKYYFPKLALPLVLHLRLAGRVVINRIVHLSFCCLSYFIQCNISRFIYFVA